jgi:hypothetical protein
VKKLVAGVGLAVAASLAIAALAFGGRAKTTMVGATLNAKQEVPAQVVKNASGKGSFTATLVGNKLTWTLKFSHLTGQAVAAHIHMGKAGKAGNVIVPLCGPCKSPMHGTSKLSKAVMKAMATHDAYVNVHTKKNLNGEIRGQVIEH